jgi:hypothetical protein
MRVHAKHAATQLTVKKGFCERIRKRERERGRERERE